jgi:hypothetical protein
MIAMMSDHAPKYQCDATPTARRFANSTVQILNLLHVNGLLILKGCFKQTV